jgi:hypothetical protein
MGGQTRNVVPRTMARAAGPTSGRMRIQERRFGNRARRAQRGERGGSSWTIRCNDDFCPIPHASVELGRSDQHPGPARARGRRCPGAMIGSRRMAARAAAPPDSGSKTSRATVWRSVRVRRASARSPAVWGCRSETAVGWRDAALLCMAAARQRGDGPTTRERDLGKEIDTLPDTFTWSVMLVGLLQGEVGTPAHRGDAAAALEARPVKQSGGQ